MAILKCYWAGQLIDTKKVSDASVSDALSELNGQLQAGLLQHETCGTRLTIGELCVDVVVTGKSIEFKSFKKKE